MNLFTFWISFLFLWSLGICFGLSFLLYKATDNTGLKERTERMEAMAINTVLDLRDKFNNEHFR